MRLTDFHVMPLSTPTRSALITGRYSIRNGAWATFKGRDVIPGDIPTIADMFKEGGFTRRLCSESGIWVITILRVQRIVGLTTLVRTFFGWCR